MPIPRPAARLFSTVLAIVAPLTAARPAAGQDVRGYFDRALWEAALLGRVELDPVIPAPPANDSTLYGGALPSLTLPAAPLGTVTAGGAGGFAIVAQGADDRGRAFTVRPRASAYEVELTFSSPITAFGADYLPNTGSASQMFSLSAPELGQYNLSTSESGWRFFGVTSTTPFSAAVVRADSPIYYDQPTVGEANAPAGAASLGVPLVAGAVYVLPFAAVPEPATVVLTGLGLGALALGRAGRRERRPGNPRS